MKVLLCLAIAFVMIYCAFAASAASSSSSSSSSARAQSKFQSKDKLSSKQQSKQQQNKDKQQQKNKDKLKQQNKDKLSSSKHMSSSYKPRERELDIGSEKFQELEGSIHDLTYMLLKIRDCDGLYYRGNCYFMFDEKVTREEAKEMCAESGGRLVRVESKHLYSLLRRYVYDMTYELEYPEAKDITVWIDGTFKDDAVTFSNGDEMTWGPIWYDTFPNTKTPSHKYMAFVVKRKATSKQHMINSEEGYTFRPLCEE